MIKQQSHALLDSKIQSATDSGRFQISMLAVVLCATAVFGLGVDYLLQPQRFPMKHINVEGELHNTHPSQIQKAIAQVVSSSNILRVDISKAVAAAQALPWVERATIIRKWPDTLHVQVNERVIRARWNDGEWLDQVGMAVTLPEFADESLPHLRGSKGSEQDVLAKYQMLQSRFEESGLEIVELGKSGRSSWEVYVRTIIGDDQLQMEDESEIPERNVIKVILGSGEPQKRAERFTQLYSEVFESVADGLAVIDMRYPDGISVQWVDGKPRLKGSAKIKSS